MGDVKGAVIVFNDISEEKRLDDSKTSFISVASHQLRTPLSAIRWYVETLLLGDAGKLTDKQSGLLDEIAKSSKRMSNLINSLLQIARVEMGRLKIDPVEVDLRGLTKTVYDLHKDTADAAGKTVNIRTKPAKLPTIKLDKDVIWQIISNLISNGLRYSSDGGVVDISIELKEGFIEYSVRDSGIGIPDEQKSRIFDKFFRATNAISKAPEGSGLGLFLVKSFVEDWGGKVWFESEVNKGSTFYFTIPLNGMTAREGEVGLKV
jgi:signal transduction histidine kinase